MMSKSTLSDTQSLLLSQASQHLLGLAAAPANLPTAARNAVVRSLLKSGLLKEHPAPFEHRDLGWRQDEGGEWLVLAITDAGLRAIGVVPDPERGMAMMAAEEAQELDLQQAALEAEAAVEGAAAQPAGAEQEPAAASSGGPARRPLREAAQAVLVAWEGAVVGQRGDTRPTALAGPLEALRAALAGRRAPARQPRDPAAPRRPREGTKQQAVLALLHRPEGATIAQVQEATGWAPHTVRGFLAGLKKRGHDVTVLDRVRQVGSGKEGAKSSYSIYRVQDAAPAEAG